MTASTNEPPAISDAPADQALSTFEAETATIPVSDAEVSQEVGALLVEQVLGSTEVSYRNGDFTRTFPYSLQVDGQNVGAQTSELTVKVATDLSDDNKDAYKFAHPKDLVVVLPRGGGFTQEVRHHLQTRAWTARNVGSPDADRAALAERERADDESLRGQLARELDELLAAARYGTCMQDITDDARMVASDGGAERFQTAVRLMAENSYTFLSALKSEFTTETVYAESLHAKLADDEMLPMYCTLALQEIRSIQAASGSCMVGGEGENSLEAHLTDENYGWPEEASRQAVGVLALNGRIACSRNGKPLEGVQLALALSQGAELNEVKIRIVKAVPHEQLSALKKAFHKATGLDVDTNEGRSISSSFKNELQKRLAEARSAHDRVQRFPFAASYEQAVSELADMAANSRDWFEERAPKEADRIHDLLDRIRDMVSFATGKDGEAFVDAHEFLTEQATNLSALPVCQEGATRLRELISDPDCYKNPEAVDEVRSLHEELQGHVEAGIAAARAKAHLELYGFERQFHEGAEYQAADEEAHQKADALLKACADEIDASAQIPAIKSMVDDFKENEGARLYAFVAPGTDDMDERTAPRPDDAAEAEQDAAQDTVPQVAAATVTYRSVARPEGWTRTLSDEADVDEFLAALRAQLIEHVEAGERIIV